MPLSVPNQRTAMHKRRIQCDGYQRQDGLWDIEGHLVDTKPFPLPNRDRGGEIATGEPLHEMWLRLTLDEGLVIRAAEAVTDHSPFAICPAIGPAYEKLVGLRVGPGFNRKARDRLGGVAGCTHLNELLPQMATAAFQTIYGVRSDGHRPDAPGQGKGIVGTCHALAGDSPVVRDFWPDFYTGEPS
ncbi:MAG: DUF2889 domain-containing protein [Chromatiales bacterium]|nr:DUF2889 domain-containing protein [Chromatiales bacterium]